jgi:hypothetical protein
LFPIATKIANIAVSSALITIASCSGSPSHDSRVYCQDEPCFKASLEKGEVGYRVLLVGDAGALVVNNNKSPAPSPLFKTLETFAESAPDRTAIVFLGDNIYDAGLPDEAGDSLSPDNDCKNRACAEQRIDAQIGVLKRSGARGFFVPGNHDWDNGGRKGWKRIKNLRKHLTAWRKTKKANVELVPKDGCPGPVTVPLLGEKVEVALIALDTQWWLHEYKKPDNVSQCKQVTETGVLASLKKTIKEESSKQRHILLVAHHPLKSNGTHGGFYSLEDLVRPIHLAEQMIRKSAFAGRQDLHNPVYKNMRVKIEKAIDTAHEKNRAPLIYAAGHDHSMQIIKGRKGTFHLVSGAGSALGATRVGKGEGTLFSHTNKKTGGFIAVDYLQSGEIRFAVIEPRSTGQECKHTKGKACVVFSARAKGFSN